ncbi:hypothetical protein AB9Q10_16500 [Streptomyces krungchingensis]
MSKRTLPRYDGPMSGYCWALHPDGRRHCTLPRGHSGTHWHPYTRASW